MGYKLCEFCENRARDTSLRGVYISHFDQISVKITVQGVTPVGRKSSKSASEYLKYRRVALRAMLPVISTMTTIQASISNQSL